MASRPRVPWFPLSLAVQLANLRSVWPDLEASVRRGILIARGWVQPSPLSQRFRVQLNYRIDAAPKVWVREPRIVGFRGPHQPVPHVHDRDTDPRPCLYYPNGREWRSDRLLATTVLPWLLLWLSFYEVWLATGVWLGEGVEHGTVKRAHV